MFVELKEPSRLNGVPLSTGEKVEVDDKIGAVWIQKGRAKKMNEEGRGPGRPQKEKKAERERPVETAVNKPGEKAVERGDSDKK